jgi:5-methylcytosine-specific restriction endonuclease McrA
LIADYKHRYHIENKEKLCQTSRDWYASNKKRAAEYNRAHYLSNKEKYAEWRKAWIAANPDRNREWNKEWRQANSERLIAASREWKRNNMVKVLTYNRNRRSISKGAEGFHSAEDILKIYRAQRGRCAHCRKDVRSGYHVDHITPLVSGGSNWPENLQILCPLCNLSKSSKDPIEWKQQHGMLL